MKRMGSTTLVVIAAALGFGCPGRCVAQTPDIQEDIWDALHPNLLADPVGWWQYHRAFGWGKDGLSHMRPDELAVLGIALLAAGVLVLLILWGLVRFYRKLRHA